MSLNDLQFLTGVSGFHGVRHMVLPASFSISFHLSIPVDSNRFEPTGNESFYRNKAKIIKFQRERERVSCYLCLGQYMHSYPSHNQVKEN